MLLTQPVRTAQSNALRGLLLLLLADSAVGDELLNQPISQSNGSPFALISGLPTMSSGKLLRAGQNQWSLSAALSNNFAHDEAKDESVWLDGETTRTVLSLQTGFDIRGSRGWQLGLDIPYIQHRGGSLDSFIEDWHDSFGLPNADREDFAQDQLAYRYDDVDNSVAIVDNAAGIGDLRLSLGKQLLRSERHAAALSLSLKLPTGDERRLTGNGATELATSVLFSGALSPTDDAFNYHLSAGLLFSNDGDVLATRRKAVVPYGGASLSWQCLSRLALKLQLDAHGALYDSELTPLQESVQLSLGGSVGLDRHWALDLAVIEDIVVDSASDVVFQLGLRYRQD
ncbi:uncharacterized protein DUF3187 [Sinobacterium caligoides]|uniref:Uncharacterized protein DUF3187 n=1 Tax=Sinobacterium caligoides TaxID=933926 RepID=A0A3N2DQD7_9GAMM|nr:DUF3187 family protein [Sinobacterium caligoides]ROS01997.1 uncharacterized protein DUF3187 [Sinobacterium caligoides]